MAAFDKNKADETEMEPATKPGKGAPGRRMKYRPFAYPNKPTKKRRSKSRERSIATRIRKLTVLSETSKDPLLTEREPPARSPETRDVSPGVTRAVTPTENSQPTSSYMPPLEPSTSNSNDDDKYLAVVPSDDAATASSSAVPQPQGRKLEILGPQLSEITSNTFSYTESSAISTKFTNGEETAMTSAFGTTQDEEDGETLSTSYTRELEEDFTNTKCKSQSTEEVDGLWSVDNNWVPYKQNIAGCSILVSALQLALLLIQLILCGFAPLAVNPLIGPFPDAFSEWGGKNAYLLLDDHQYFRLLTPILLHVGVLHLVVNAFCQLETCALFEREWGSGKWLISYLTSGLGAVATSCAVNPDQIGVSSSGALMGLFGSKIAQIVTYTSFELDNNLYVRSIGMDQLGSILCSIAVLFLLSLVSYIDLSGHVGGFLTGYLVGIILFCEAIESSCTRFFWLLLGFSGLIGGAIGLSYFLWVETYPDNELEDSCQYFRNLYPEGYDCECQLG